MPKRKPDITPANKQVLPDNKQVLPDNKQNLKKRPKKK
jgi:hypothetical protein